MYCQNCGKELSTDVVFCPSCGTKIDSNSGDVIIKEHNNNVDNPDLTKTAPELNKKKINKKAMILIVIFAVILLLFVLLLGLRDESLEKPEGDNDNSEQTTLSVVADDDNLTADEKLEVLKTAADIDAIADYFSVCPEDKKSDLLEIFKNVFLTFLTENRSEIYSHDIEFIDKISEIIAKIEDSVLTTDEELIQIVEKINNINANIDGYKKYKEAQKLVRKCMDVDGEIVKRIGDSSNEGEYLDEYMLEYSRITEGVWEDTFTVIIYSEESLQPGRFIGYLKYKDTKEYVSDGFDYSFDVYTIMTDREIEKFFKAEDDMADLSESAYSVDVQFDELCELVENHAKKCPALIDDNNYIADYVGGYKDFPYEYLHKLTLNSDNTFDLAINMYEGFAEYSGTFKKEGNLITCENDDIYFELVISGETLVYHNLLEYSTVYMSDGTLFIR